MKTGILAIYDLDVNYANSLMEYISGKQGMPFKTMAFTQKEALIEYSANNHIDILLISSTVMEESIAGNNIGKIILLSPGKIFSEYIEYSSIYKYQSTENIIREVLDYYVDVHKEEGLVSTSKGNANIIGVYSPLRRTGQTTFALTLGQILAADNSTLYINMEEFSAFDRIFGQNYPGDLSDLMYFYKQNSEALPIKLQAVVNNLHGMDYVPPLTYSEDLRNVASEEWGRLIKKIADTDVYQNIILDLSSMVSDVFKILDICNVIYTPIQDDRISMMKISSYEEYLLKTEREELVDKTIKIKIPEDHEQKWNEEYLEQQLWGKLGDFIRKILKGAA